MNSPTPRVERQFSDGDTHPTSALIAESQNPLAVGDDDNFDIVKMRMAQNARDMVFIGNAKKYSSWLPEILTESLASAPHGWCVNDRKHLFDMPNQQSIIKYRSEEHTSELQSPDHLVCR